MMNECQSLNIGLISCVPRTKKVIESLNDMNARNGQNSLLD